MRQTFNSSPHPIYILLGGHWNAISPSFRENWVQLESKLAISRFLPGVVGSSQTGAVEQIQFKILPFNEDCYIVHWQVRLDMALSQSTTDNYSGPMQWRINLCLGLYPFCPPREFFVHNIVSPLDIHVLEQIAMKEKRFQWLLSRIIKNFDIIMLGHLSLTKTKKELPAKSVEGYRCN